MTHQTTVFERHFQTGLQVLIVTGIIGGVNLLAQLNTKVEVMNVQINALTSRSEQYVTKDVMEQRSRTRDMQIMQMNQRLDNIEKKIYNEQK